MRALGVWVLVLAAAAAAQETPADLAVAEAQYREERFDAAVRSFQILRGRADTTDEKDYLSLRIVRVLLALGKTRHATLELRRLTDREAPYPPALIEEARLHQELLPEEPGSLERVERALRRALRLTPDSPGAWVQWGHFARARGRNREAVERYRKVTDSLDPSFVEAWFGLARATLAMGQPAEALAVLDRCLEVAPREAEAHWFAGRMRWAVGGEGWKEAVLGHYQDAMAYAPSTSRYRGAVMVVHFLDQDPVSAEPILSLLEVEAPHGSYTWLGRGMRAELSGGVAAARQAYEMALAADARNVWAHFFLGGILAGRGNPELVGAGFDAGRYPVLDAAAAARHLRLVARQAPEFPLRDGLRSALAVAESH